MPILRGNTRENGLGGKLIGKGLTQTQKGVNLTFLAAPDSSFFSIVVRYATFGLRRETSPSVMVEQELHP